MNSTPAMPTDTVAFVGGGNMARCLVEGLLRQGADPARIRVAEPDAGTRTALARDFALRTFEDNAQAVRGATTWVLAVKPQLARHVCEGLAARAREQRPLLVSIMAGVGCTQIAGWLGGQACVVRCMPNTPAAIGAGISGLFAAAALDDAQRTRVETLLAGTGETVWVHDEARMDAVTAVSGSGPAYVYLLAEAMEQAALRQGLAPADARRLVAGTVLGAARMMAASTATPAELRRRVTSPGGTTQAAVQTLEAGGLAALVDAAIAQAVERGRTLAEALATG